MEHAHEVPVGVETGNVAVVLLEDIAEERLAGARCRDQVGLGRNLRPPLGAARPPQPVDLRERSGGAPAARRDLRPIQPVDALGGRHDTCRNAEQRTRERPAARAHEPQRRDSALERAGRVVLRLRRGGDAETGADGPLDGRHRIGSRRAHPTIDSRAGGALRGDRRGGQEQRQEAHH